MVGNDEVAGWRGWRGVAGNMRGAWSEVRKIACLLACSGERVWWPGKWKVVIVGFFALGGFAWS